MSNKLITVGIDEVGRGPLAGPVVAVACAMPDDFTDDRIRDSKKITSEKKREMLAKYIEENALSLGVGIVCNILIDKVNILKATRQAMHVALRKIDVDYDRIIVDSVFLKHMTKPFANPNRGEDAHISVAAASIYAKVYRDNLMKRLHLEYPMYNWYKNKGYGAKVHTDAIKEHGLSPYHRRSFCGNFMVEAD